jgi:hypothetical protein
MVDINQSYIPYDSILETRDHSKTITFDDGYIKLMF